MTTREHQYAVTVEWTGNEGSGTSGYRDFSRSHSIHASGKSSIEGSADPAFRGDPACWNPEELLVASLSACHKLWYLHLCASAGVIVQAYEDRAQGVMEESSNGSGRFTSVVIRPTVTITPESDKEQALALHEKAHDMCFIANSVNFPVKHEPKIQVGA